jgi:hypothetical protein
MVGRGVLRVKGDGNVGMLVSWIVSDLHTPGIEAIVRRYVVDAMVFHRNRRYFFSDRTLRFSLTAGRRDYRPGDGFGLPADLVEIASRTIWLLLSGLDTQREPCLRSSTSLFEESVASWGGSRSYPDQWDFRTGALRFSPTPSSASDVVELRYLTNLGIPRLAYESGAFAYYHPTTGENITAEIDSWSNDWTSQEAGATAIRLRAQYSVQKSYLRDLEGANETLAAWLEAVGQLEDETESKTAGVQYLEGCLLD